MADILSTLSQTIRGRRFRLPLDCLLRNHCRQQVALQLHREHPWGPASVPYLYRFLVERDRARFHNLVTGWAGAAPAGQSGQVEQAEL